MLLHGKDSCHIRIASIPPPGLPKIESVTYFPVKIPFRLVGSRIFFDCKLNGKEVVAQLDLGAGTGAVNKNSIQKIGLEFTSQQLVSNTDGTNYEQTSLHNILNIGALTIKDVALTTVGNMEPFEDLIIGNNFFRNHIIEINYDNLEFRVYQTLPEKVKNYSRSPVFFEQNRPKFKARVVHNHRKYDFWFLFDTGRDGTMLIGEDFTSLDGRWDRLQPLTIINGRKIIRLNAVIAGTEFRDIVTNAADPSKPNGRSSLFGNQILNHFNCILDNRNGMLYLQPNGKIAEPFFNFKSYQEEMIKKNKK